MNGISPPAATLDNGFWRVFADEIWERKPLKLPASPARPVVTPELLFQALVQASDAYRDGDPDVVARWLENGEVTVAHAGAHAIDDRLPMAADGSLVGYADRLARVGGHSDYLLNLPNPYAWNEALWNSVRDFAAHIYGLVGMVGDGALCDTYVGKYAATPFGVHLDGASNFTFGLHGQKTLYLWGPEFYEREMRGAAALDYRQFIDDALALTVGPGEIIYWPSRYWHIADSGRAFSVTMNVAFYPAANPAKLIKNALHQALDDELDDFPSFDYLDFDSADIAGNGARLPQQLEQLVRHFGELSRDGTLDQRLRAELARSWLRKLTCLGLPLAPKFGARDALDIDDVIAIDRRHAIVMTKLAVGTLAMAANGRLAETTAHPGIGGLVERLNSGDGVRIRDLMEEFAGSADVDGESVELSRDDIHAIATMLYNWRAVHTK